MVHLLASRSDFRIIQASLNGRGWQSDSIAIYMSFVFALDGDSARNAVVCYQLVSQQPKTACFTSSKPLPSANAFITSSGPCSDFAP